MLNLLKNSSFRRTTSTVTIFFMSLLSVSAYAAPTVLEHGGLFQPTDPGASHTTAIVKVDGDFATITNNTTANGIAIVGAVSTTNSALTFTNRAGDVSVSAGISSTSGDLDFVNETDAGTTTANISLGNNASSTVVLQGGSLVGNITMGSDNQTVTFSGGAQTGDVLGNTGSVVIDSENQTTLGGDVFVSNVIINDGRTLSNSRDKEISAAITIGENATFDFGAGVVSGSINGTANGNGTLRFSEVVSTDIGIGTVDGDGAITNRLALIEVNESTTLNSGGEIAATSTTINNNKTLTLGTDTALYSNVNIINNGKVVLEDGASIRTDGANTIGQIVSGDGRVEVSSGDTATLEGVIGTADNAGTTGVDERIAAVNVLSGSTLNIAANSTINATETNLSSGANLNLGATTTVNSLIQSAESKTAGQGTGTVTITSAGNNVNLNSDIGTATRYVSKLDLESTSTLTLDGENDLYVDSIELNNGSTLSLAGSTVKATNGINGESANQGSLTLTAARTLTNSDFQIGSTNTAISNLTINNTSAVVASSGYNIRANTVAVAGTSSLTLNAGTSGTPTTITGNVTVETGSSLTVNTDTTVTGTILGSSDGVGTLNVSGTYSSSDAIGSAPSSLNTVSLASGATLNSAHGLDASTITLNANAVLNVNASTLVGAINGVSGGNETINFNSDLTLAAGTTIGGNIDDVNIADDADVTANANISATRIDIGDGASGSLSVGTGITVSSAINLDDNATLNLDNTASVTGDINGVEAGQGKISLGASDSVTQGGDIGATTKIATVELGAGSTLTVGDNTLKATGVVLGNAATLNLAAGDVDTLEATIKGSANNTGIVNLTGNRTIEENTFLGINEAALSQLNISASRTVSLNEDIFATTTLLGNGAQATLAADKVITGNVTLANTSSTLVLSGVTSGTEASVVGTINGVDAGDQGVLNIASDAEVYLGGSVGATNTLRSVVVSDDATLTTGENQLRVHASNGSITLGEDSTLAIGTGAVSGNAIDGSGAARGRVIFTENNSIAVDTKLGSTNDTRLSAVDVAYGKTVTISENVRATTLTVGTSYNSSTSENATVLTLDTDADVTGNAVIGENSKLTMSGTSSVSGTINGSADNQGILEISSNGQTIALAANVGETNALSLVSVLGTSTLNAGANTIEAENITLASGSTLTTSATIIGAIDGATDDDGTLTIADDVDLGATSVIGDTNKINNLLITGGTLTTAANVNATTVNVGSNTDAGFDVGAGTTVIAAVRVANDSVLTVNNNSVITGTINGEANNEGVLNISDDSTFAAGGAIGQTNFLKTITIGEDSTFSTGAHDVRATAIDAEAGSVFNLGNANTVRGNITLTDATMNFGNNDNNVTGNITSAGGSTFNLGTGGHEVAGDVVITESDVIKFTADSTSYGALNSTGDVAIAEGASVDFTIDSRLAFANAGSSYEIITAATATNMIAVEGENIDVNALGSNRMGLLTFESAVVDDKLVMTINRDQASDVTSNASAQVSYNAINNVGGVATGELRTVQDYVVTSTSTTAGQREKVLESITQNDVGVNQAVFTGIMSSINIIENRMSNLSLSAPSYKVTDARGNKVKGLDKSATALGNGYGSDSSNETTMGRSVWGQVVGTTAKQANSGGFNGYDANTRGIAFGIDQSLDKDLLVGAAFNINNTDITSTNGAKKVNVDSYQLTLYGEKKYGEYFVDGFVAGALNRFETDRHVALVGKTASAAYDGYSYTAKARVGMIERLENGFDIVPHAGLVYSYNSSTNYQESGAGTLDLSVNSGSSEMLIGDVGVALSYDADFFKYRLRPEFKVSYGHDFIGNSQVSSANFVGQSALLNISNSRSDRNILRMGAGADLYSLDQFTLNASYLLEKRETYQSHTGLLKAKYSF